MGIFIFQKYAETIQNELFVCSSPTGKIVPDFHCSGTQFPSHIFILIVYNIYIYIYYHSDTLRSIYFVLVSSRLVAREQKKDEGSKVRCQSS